MSDSRRTINDNQRTIVAPAFATTVDVYDGATIRVRVPFPGAHVNVTADENEHGLTVDEILTADEAIALGNALLDAGYWRRGNDR